MPANVTNRTRIVGTSFFLFCLALFLTAYSAKNPRVASAGAILVAEAFRPIQAAYNSTAGAVRDVWDYYFYLVGVVDENRELRERLAQLEAENTTFHEMKSEMTRLQELLKMRSEAKLEGEAARVIGYDPSNWVQAVTVDKGLSSGIEVEMAVLDKQGVVGQVVSTSLTSARVLLITDRGNGVDALIQESRVRGVVEGTGKDSCELRYVLKDEEVKVGERVITSGLDGIYGKGLLIGIVSEIDKRGGGLFQTIKLKPAVNFNTLESVLIVGKTKVR